MLNDRRKNFFQVCVFVFFSVFLICQVSGKKSPVGDASRKHKRKYDHEDFLGSQEHQDMLHLGASLLKKDHISYDFSYHVKDEESGVYFAHQEERNGPKTEGEYRVALPDGRIQVVSYVADEGGYRSKVSYIDKNESHYEGDSKKKYESPSENEDHSYSKPTEYGSKNFDQQLSEYGGLLNAPQSSRGSSKNGVTKRRNRPHRARFNRFRKNRRRKLKPTSATKADGFPPHRISLNGKSKNQTISSESTNKSSLSSRDHSKDHLESTKSSKKQPNPNDESGKHSHEEISSYLSYDPNFKAPPPAKDEGEIVIVEVEIPRVTSQDISNRNSTQASAYFAPTIPINFESNSTDDEELLLFSSYSSLDAKDYNSTDSSNVAHNLPKVVKANKPIEHMSPPHPIKQSDTPGGHFSQHPHNQGSHFQVLQKNEDNFSQSGGSSQFSDNGPSIPIEVDSNTNNSNRTPFNPFAGFPQQNIPQFSHFQTQFPQNGPNFFSPGFQQPLFQNFPIPLTINLNRPVGGNTPANDPSNPTVHSPDEGKADNGPVRGFFIPFPTDASMSSYGPYIPISINPELLGGQQG